MICNRVDCKRQFEETPILVNVKLMKQLQVHNDKSVKINIITYKEELEELNTRAIEGIKKRCFQMNWD